MQHVCPPCCRARVPSPSLSPSGSMMVVDGGSDHPHQRTYELCIEATYYLGCARRRQRDCKFPITLHYVTPVCCDDKTDATWYLPTAAGKRIFEMKRVWCASEPFFLPWCVMSCLARCPSKAISPRLGRWRWCPFWWSKREPEFKTLFSGWVAATIITTIVTNAYRTRRIPYHTIVVVVVVFS